ncbi:phage portal protein [Wolbachia endosymbiont of Ctenocephalides felis wCfeT]|uniref:phage portal protein n=1 Tax=Wolbachia endosymbiont of Ctenocephalides felis wCfeT TaxID=2732593 RepID=UPI0014451A4B|nr:phage portal protein [Wolbachia endosymbiont of Ctenocephalides felis wCfeT]
MWIKSIKQLLNRLPKTRSSAWDSSGSGRRLTYWQPERSGINSLLVSNLETLRSRSRDMVRKNPYAASIIDTVVSNCVGTGIKPQSKAKDAEFRKRVQELWLQWTDEADSNNISDFYGLQALVCRSMVEGGECFVRLRTRKPEDGFSVPLQLQVLESEHLDNKTTQALANGNVIRNGIEFNRLGQREAYYLFREHPGENLIGESVRVPASDVLHVYKPLRPGQIRGEPWLSSVLLKLYELDQYDDAELVRKKTAAMFAGFITRLDPEANIMGENESDEHGVALSGLEPGTMQLLDPGEDIKFSEPSDVGGSYEAFMRQQLRAIAIGIGITYEQLTGDLTNVNYSSIRAGLIEFRRRCAMLQHNIMIFQFCRPVWERWLELATLSGKLPMNKKTENFKDVKWIPQGFDWVDPLKDQQAQQMAVRNGFKSRSEVISEMGYDAEEIDQEIAEDQKRADSFNLFFDSDTRSTQQKS